MQIEGRAADDLEHVARRGLVFERFRQLRRAFLDLVFELGVGGPQIEGHAVELVRQAFELVAGADVEAAVEIARADPRGALLHLADGAGHAPSEEQGDEGRSGEPQPQQDHAAQCRAVERCVGLAQRHLDKDQPTERRDHRVRAQHRAVVAVARDRYRRRGRRRRRPLPQRRGDLRQMQEIGVAQHQADVRVGDQPAAPIDDIGIAALADLQTGDDIPDQLEVDLGDGDPGVAPGARDGEGHIRFRFLAEIDRAEPHLVGARLAEGRRLGQILAAADDIHRQARDLELFFAVMVELGNLGDRRHLAQQPHIVEAALVERRGRPLRMRRPADLALDLLDEFLDALRRRVGLFLLDANHRRLVFLIAEPEVEAAVDEQRHADQADKK